MDRMMIRPALWITGEKWNKNYPLADEWVNKHGVLVPEKKQIGGDLKH